MRRLMLVAVLIVSMGQQADAEPVTITTDARYPEGPLWDADGLYFAEMTADRISVWNGAALATFWVRPGCGPTSIARYRITDFIVLCHLEGVIVHVSGDGRTLKIFDADNSGQPLQNPNDASSDGSGGVYFSDSGRFRKGAPAEGAVLLIDSEGQIRRLVDGLAYANGIYYDPSTRNLFVSEHLGRRVLRFPVLEAGKLDQPVTFVDFDTDSPPARRTYAESGPDGLEIDRMGRVWVCEYGQGRVLVYTSNGEFLGQINFDTPYLTNVAISSNGHFVFTGAYNNEIFPYRGAVTIMSRTEAINSISLNLESN